MSLQGEVRPLSAGQESGSAIRSILIPFAITLVSLFGFAAWSVGQAVTVITVTVGNDFTTAGQTTLRDAINIANSTATPCPCLIDFDPTVTNVIPSFALPDITKDDVTIDGGGTVAITSSSGSFPGITLGGQNGALTGVGIGGFSTGVFITNDNNEVLTSTIGSPLQPNQNGIEIDDGIDNRIIGNSIVGNGGFAISLTSAAVANEILNNEIASNAGGGIDLGVSFQDVGDADTGFGNEGQNYPELSNARLVGGNLEVTVDVDSSGVPATQGLLIELFESDGSFFPSSPQGATSLGSQCFAGNLITAEQMTVPAGSLSFGSEIVGTATSYADSACTPGNANDGTSQFSFSASAGGGFVVNTTADYPLPDSDPGVTSLREAITEANLVCGSVDCTVLFNIPTGDSGYNATEGTFNIVLSSALGALPPIQVSYLTIDGASQTAFSGDTNTAGPEIVVNGEQLGAPAHGLVVDGSSSSVFSCVINDLVIQGFPGDGIRVVGGTFTSSGTRIAGNYLGTNATGTAAVPNTGDGIHLTSFVTYTRIIGNVISGNTGYGVYAGLSSGDNRIESNRIGTGASGLAPLGNGLGGIYLDSSYNSVGFNLLVDDANTETDEPTMRSRPIRRDEAKQPSVGILTHAPLFGGNIIAFNNGPGVLLDNGA
ncbi:MAG: right-handed parallel beta-helix repeat-containing protein, partial [Acidobacteria bacterium]|nr:right-handed parallel beta-helix repeat-containing protein [Acidobacteriota bacterium]